MKKVFSKNVWKKFLASMMIVVSLMFLAPEKVRADGDTVSKLAEPIADLMLIIGDGLVSLMHKYIMDQDCEILTVDLKDGVLLKIARRGGAILVGIATAIGLVVAAVFILPAVVGVVSSTAAAIVSGTVMGSLFTIGSVAVLSGIEAGVSFYSWDLWGDTAVLPLYTLSPEEIFKGKIGLFNVNFFDTTLNNASNETQTNNESNATQKNIAEQLQPTISSWYNILRTIALVGMLSVLVYIGIRILISSSSTNKAKYKELLVDWCVGICLLFVMHYFMAFMNMAVDMVTEVLTDINNSNSSGTWVELVEDKDDKIKDAIEKDLKEYNVTVGPQSSNPTILEEKDKDDNKIIIWPTNLMGFLRMEASYARTDGTGYWGYAVMFFTLVIMTVIFVFTYLKRVVYMAFLTLIAPFVALTYPLDKVKDGKAQGFDFWFKEYLYNLLLQPLHLLLYTIVMSSAIELARTNVIYGMVTLAFLLPFEKLLKQMFGFKGTTPGSFGDVVGAGVIMNGMKSLLGKAPKEEDQKIETEKSSGKTRTKDVDWNKLGVEDNSEQSESTNINDTNTQEQIPKTKKSSKEPLKQGLKDTANNNKNSKATQTVKRAGALAIAGAVGKQIARNTGRRMLTRVKKIKPTRFVAGAALGALGASLGLAAGMASGDFSKTASFVSAGGLAGNKAGRGVASVFGVEEAFDAVGQSIMTDEQKARAKRKEVLQSEAYQLARDTESKETKKILDSRTTDNTRLRDGLIDAGFVSHSEQERVVAYALAEGNKERFAGLQSKNEAQRKVATEKLLDEVVNIKRLSDNIGVDNFNELDSSAKQSKMEQIAKRSDKAKYDALKKQKQQHQSEYEAAKNAKDKNEAMNRVKEVEKQMGSLPNASKIVDRINIWGRTDKS